MRPNFVKATLKTAVLAATILLLGVSATIAQQQINLTAAPSSVILPDGSSVPMWGYSCGTAASGSADRNVPASSAPRSSRNAAIAAASPTASAPAASPLNSSSAP